MGISLASVAGCVSLAAGLAIYLAGKSFEGVAGSFKQAADRFQTVLAEVSEQHQRERTQFQGRERELMLQIMQMDLDRRLHLIPSGMEPDEWVHEQIAAVRNLLRCSQDEAVGILLRGMRSPADGRNAEHADRD